MSDEERRSSQEGRGLKSIVLVSLYTVGIVAPYNETEDYDRTEKMEIYRKAGVSEYWLVDWRKKQVEIYLFDGKDDGTTYSYLYKTVTEENKEELQIVIVSES